MSVPVKRKSKSVKKRAVIKVWPKIKRLTPCQNCKKMITPHRVCPFCGKYMGETIVEFKTPTDKKNKKPAESKKEEKKQETKS